MTRGPTVILSVMALTLGQMEKETRDGQRAARVDKAHCFSVARPTWLSSWCYVVPMIQHWAWALQSMEPVPKQQQ